MSHTALTLAEDLTLPVDIAGQTTAIFGIRGSGKTNSAGTLAEELLDRRRLIAVVDPTDAWWGLRAGRDGTQTGGYQVFIFGGSHADVPLSETDGKVIADFLVREKVPVILSLRHLRKAAQRRFVTEFCEELYHLKGKDEHRTPLTVFIDEAPLFVPQKVMGEVARTVGAVEDLIARGRNAGFGVVLISQRSATLNADVRTQADTIICHRVTAALDRKAISDWFEENASTSDLKAILHSLATLKNGEAWVWAPSLDVMQRVQVRLRRTFDSSATPKVGETALLPPKKLADVDLDKLKGRLAVAMEQSRENDPALLRKRIAELEADKKEEPRGRLWSWERPSGRDGTNARVAELEASLRTARQELQKAVRVQRIEVPVMHQKDWKRLGDLETSLLKGCVELTRLVERFSKEMPFLAEKLTELRSLRDEHAGEGEATAPPKPAAPRPPPDRTYGGFTEGVRASPAAPEPARRREPAPPREGAANGAVGLGRGERAVLVAVAQTRGGVTHTQVTLLTGYKRRTRDAYLQRLAAAGLVTHAGELTIATKEGLALLGSRFKPLPTGRALREHHLTTLPTGERRCFEIAVGSYPDAVAREFISQETKYARRTRDAYIQRLCARNLIVDIGRGQVKAAEGLFR